MTILKMQIGPVQEFIAQARSTRDLWSGSYLLSWLVAAGIRRLQMLQADLVFPNPAKQPLLLASWPSLTEQENTKFLTPNFTNIFVATIPSGKDSKEIAEDVARTICEEWTAIYTAVWNNQDLIELGQQTRFTQQAENFLTISWSITPLAEDNYATAYDRNGWQLDAVRQTRDFQAWSAGATEIGTNFNKDSLSGKEEAVAGGPGFLERLDEKIPRSDFSFLFKHEDWLGAVAVIKRIWHLAYLRSKCGGLKTSSTEFPIRSTRAIAAKSGELDDKVNIETLAGEKYFAVLAFDGDQIGKWLSGEFLADKSALRSHHSAFSAALSDFALNQVRGIVEKPGAPDEKYGGFLVYAGGDDVLALLPAEHALKCAQELRAAFRTATQAIVGETKEGRDTNGQITKSTFSPDASVGIAIAHFKSPLQDVVRAAMAAEKRAKQKLGRSAVAVSLFKRSGEIVEWGCQWDGGGLDLYHTIANALGSRQLSGKFPYRVSELLQPYLTETSPFTKECQSLEAVDSFDQEVRSIALREFGTALGQQTPLRGEEKKTLIDTVTAKLETYLGYLDDRFTETHKKFGDSLNERRAQTWESPRKPDFVCGHLIGLCQTLAFVERNRASTGADSKPSAAVPTPPKPAEMPPSA